MIQTEVIGVRRVPRGKILAAYLRAQTAQSPAALYRMPQGGWDIRRYAPALRRYPRLHQQYLLAQGLGPQSVMVPNVVGLTQAAATVAIAGAGLTLGAVTSAYSNTVALGSVISQTPGSGMSVLTGTSIALVISQGPQLTVPNVVGQTSTVARSQLTSLGFTSVSSSVAASATVAAGAVVSQNVPAGTLAPGTTPIALVISSGPPVLPLGTMPNLVGLPYDEAYLALEQAGILVLSKLGYFSNWPITLIWEPSSQPPTIVLAQSVAPGQSVSINAPMTLTVSQFSTGVIAP